MAPSVINLSDTVPAAPAGTVNVAWQGDSNNPRNVSANLPALYIGVVPKTSSYGPVLADSGSLLVAQGSGAVVFTLPGTPPSVVKNGKNVWNIGVQNLTSGGSLTLTPTSPALLNGSAASVTLSSGQGFDVFTDGTNYFYFAPGSSGGGGGLNGAVVKTAAYTAVGGDNGKLLSFNASSAVTLLLPASPPSSTWTIFVENISTNNLTVSPNGLNLDGGAASLTLIPGTGCSVWTDGTNYFTSRGMNDHPVWVMAECEQQPTAGQVIGRFVAPTVCSFPGNWSNPNAYGVCATNPTSTATLTVYKNTTNVGSISISTSGVFTFTTISGATVVLNPLDEITIVAPGTPDANLAGIGVILQGTRAPVPAVATVLGSFTWRGTYGGATAYNVNDVVYFHGASYICTTPTTGNNPLNATYWALMASGWVSQGAYNGATQYFPNDIVISGGSTYLCILTTTGNAPPNATYWVVLAQAGSLTVADQQNQTYDYVVGGGTANAATATTTPAYTGPTDGQQISVKWPTTNTTTTPTLNVSSTGAIAVKVPGTTGFSNPAVGQLVGGCQYVFTYNSTGPCWQLTGNGGGSVPVAISQGPDWPPASPTAWDDEFTGGSLNTTLWSHVVTGRAGNQNAVGQSKLGMYGANGAGDNFQVIMQPVPPTPYSFACKMEMTVFAYNFGYAGLALSDGTKYVTIKLDNEPFLGIDHWNSNSSFNSSSFQLTMMSGAGTLYLKILDDGTNLTFSVSRGGTYWFVMNTQARTSFLSAVTYMGLFMGTNDASHSHLVEFDWFRRLS